MKPVYVVSLLGCFFLFLGIILTFALENIYFIWLTVLGVAILLGICLVVGGSSEARNARDRMFVKEQEAKVEALCEHLTRIGLTATVESKEHKLLEPMHSILGSVRVVSRNVDSVELQEMMYEIGDREGSFPEKHYAYRCSFVVQAMVEGLEEQLNAEGKRVRKSFWRRQVVDFKWKGNELAQLLQNDAELRRALLSQRRPSNILVAPYKTDECVRIMQARRPYDSPAETFPTIEEFEVCDRIAQHIHEILQRYP